MKHLTFSGDPSSIDRDWHYLKLISQTPEDVETLRALASLIPHYDSHADQSHNDPEKRTRRIFPVIKNTDGSHELRLVCIPPNDPRC